jgi:hypothetical protein
VGLVAFILFVQFLIVSGPRVVPAMSWRSPQGLPLFLALCLSVVGVLLAWRWEMAGGGLALASAAAMILLVYLGSGTSALFATSVLSLPLLLASALHLGCCWRTRSIAPN